MNAKEKGPRNVAVRKPSLVFRNSENPTSANRSQESREGLSAVLAGGFLFALNEGESWNNIYRRRPLGGEAGVHIRLAPRGPT
jgi:hypothetical protein